jgi:outer membrane lipoprotein carrier protein
VSFQRLVPSPPVLAVAALLGVLAGPAAAQQRADALAAALQERYAEVRDFSADFVHTYRGGVLSTAATERGHVRVRKPGMMHWTYTSPEAKEFVSDGRQVYSYIPADRQVFVSDVPPDDQLGTPALFLAGKGNITRDFEAAYADVGAPEGATVLRLTPRMGDLEYAYLDLTLDTASLRILALSARDLQGGESTIAFSNLQENQGLTDNDFVFQVPRNVDVITDDAF